MSGPFSMHGGDPIGMPALVVIGLGFFAFSAAVIRARSARPSGNGETTARRSRTSVLGIAIQGLAICFASMGVQRVTLDPLSGKALTEAAVVALLMAATVGLFAWASRTMGRNWSLVARTRSDHTLVTTGPFAWIRHPIYTAMFLMIIALTIALGHENRLWIALPLYVLGTFIRVRIEERLLRIAFGSAYEEYAARVKRFIPGVL